MTKKDREEHFSEKEALVFHTQGRPGKIENQLWKENLFYLKDSLISTQLI